MGKIKFSQIPASEVHPVSRFGYDPLPGNKGEYIWDEDAGGYVPGRYIYEFDVESGLFRKVGSVRK